MKPHQKHPPLARPHRGEFAAREIAILGGPCGLIRELAEGYMQRNVGAKLAYADASHKAGESAVPIGMQWMDHQSHATLSGSFSSNPWQRRIAFQDCAAVLVNGNHFDATAQLVLVHPDKLGSLERRLDKLTNVKAVVLCEGSTDWPAFLTAKLDADTPTLKQAEIDLIDAALSQHLLAPTPVVGLVLAGGKSSRMGEDKGKMVFNDGRPQREWLTSLLGGRCDDVYVSCRPDQEDEISKWATPLPDRLVDFGPYGALMTAFMHRADCAYFVVACDMPEFGTEAMDYLLARRNTHKVATAYCKDAEAFPEPLCSIWEASSYSSLTAFLSQGNSCPRKVLINSEIERVISPNTAWLKNVNSREDLARKH